LENINIFNIYWSSNSHFSAQQPALSSIASYCNRVLANRKISVKDFIMSCSGCGLDTFNKPRVVSLVCWRSSI